MTREEINEEKQKEIFKEEKKEIIKKTTITIIKLTIIIIVSVSLFLAYTSYISTTKIGVREYRVTNSKIPEIFNGLKIIQISDLHFGSTMFLDDVKKIVKLTNERKPDLVLYTGDLIDKDFELDSKLQEKLINELKKINAKLGKYAIAGDEDNEKVLTIFNQSDYIILRNEYELIYKDNNLPILLVGLSSLEKNEQDIDKAFGYYNEDTHNSNIYTIAFFHEPDAADDILSKYNADLMLAGHSHNGLIRIPVLNYPIFKVKGAEKYSQDYYKIDKTKLYISSGLGTINKKNIRLFCRPSINFFRLSQK